jgi:hypothetical protein
VVSLGAEVGQSALGYERPGYCGQSATARVCVYVCVNRNISQPLLFAEPACTRT